MSGPIFASGAAVTTIKDDAPLPLPWRHIALVPKDGRAFLLFGIHDAESVRRLDAPVQRGIVAGDHWWAIGLWDVWRAIPPPKHFANPDEEAASPRIYVGADHLWVFAKDGVPLWTPPLAWCELTVPNPGICEPVRADSP